MQYYYLTGIKECREGGIVLVRRDEFIDQLLIVLDDDRVVKKLFDVMDRKGHNIILDHVKPTHEYDVMIEKERNQNKNLLKEIESLKQLLQKVEMKHSLLQKEHSELESRHHVLNKEYLDLKSSWKDVRESYDTYLSLSSEVRESLKGIFRGGTIEEFFSCGVQYENIESLWDFIKIGVLEEKETDSKSLIFIFIFFFKAFNKIFASPLYVMEETNQGQLFDYDLHIRTGSSKVMGQISYVLLPGYRNAKTNKLIKKSVVKV